MSRAALVATAIVLAATASGVGGEGERRPTARLVGPTPVAVVGRPWTGTLRVTGTIATPRVVARRGGRSVRAAVVRRGRGRFRVRITFPGVGRWQLAARFGNRLLTIARLRVVPGDLLLEQPGQALWAGADTLLVTERGRRDRILAVDARTGAARVFARGLDEPFGLAPGRHGPGILVSGAGGIYRVPEGSRRAEPHIPVAAGPIAQARTEDALFFADRDVVGRIGAGGAVQRYAVDVESPHAVAVSADGSLVVLDSGHNRILRVDPASGAFTVVAEGLRVPLGLAEQPDGELLVAEYASGRLTRVARNGERTVVATGLSRPYSVALAPDGAAYVVEAGELGRPSGSIKRVGMDGRITAVRLRLVAL